MFERLQKWINRAFAKRELYARASPEDIRKLQNQGIVAENARLMKQHMDDRKKIDNLQMFKDQMLGKLREEEDKQVAAQQTVIKKIKKTREALEQVKTPKPLTIISAYSHEPFRDAMGEPIPYFWGWKYYTIPGVSVPVKAMMLSKKPNGTPMELKTNPPTFMHRDFEIYREPMTYVHSLNITGMVEVNITPDGQFVGRQAVFTYDSKKGKNNGKGKEQ